MALPWDPDMGGWVVNEFGMITPAMKPMDLEQLWTPGQFEEDNVSLSGVDGDLERDVFIVGASYAIRMQLVGDVDHEGAPTSGLKAGTAANYRAVSVALAKSAWPRASSCDMTVDCPDGVTMTGHAQVKVGSLGREAGAVSRFVVTVTIPAGELT